MTFNKGNIFKTKNVKLNLIRVDSFPLENGHLKTLQLRTSSSITQPNYFDRRKVTNVKREKRD